MSKKAGFAELPGIFARPIIKSEIDPALFVKARACFPERATPEEVEANAVIFEETRRMLLLARRLKIDVTGGESWFGIARWLAEKFDPAFHVLDTPPRRAGRPGKVAWGGLYDRVQRLVADGMKVNAARDRVAEESGVNPKTLRRMCRKNKGKSGRAAAPIITSEIPSPVVDIARRGLPEAAGTAEARERAAALLQASKLFELAEALGLAWESESDWFFLSLLLAKIYLPGLRTGEPVPTAQHADIVAAVKNKREAAAESTSWACQRLWNRDREWRERHESAAALETAFYAANRKDILKSEYRPIVLAAYLSLIESAGGLDEYLALLFRSEESPLHAFFRQATADRE